MPPTSLSLTALVFLLAPAEAVRLVPGALAPCVGGLRPLRTVPAPQAHACAEGGPVRQTPLQCMRVVRWAVQRGAIAARAAVRAATVLLFALLISVPLPSSAARALTAPVADTVTVVTEGPAARWRYFGQPSSSTPVVTETGLPSLNLRLPGMDSTPVGGARRKTSFVTAAVQAVGPAVVRIDTERLVDRPALEGYLFPGLEPDGQRRESGQGSGVILSEDGAAAIARAAAATGTGTGTGTGIGTPQAPHRQPEAPPQLPRSDPASPRRLRRLQRSRLHPPATGELCVRRDRPAPRSAAARRERARSSHPCQSLR